MIWIRTFNLFACLILVFSIAACSTNTATPQANIYGNYRISADHAIGIDQFVNDAHENVILISDYQSGVVRRLFPTANDEYAMGPGFNDASPAELKVRLSKDAGGSITGLSLQTTNGTPSDAKRMPITERQVEFENGPAKLAGTLMIPDTKGPHPAIALLHGSGPLTRYSFGPYPHFFTSLGFAVLIYDKRGTGTSTGARLDASSGAVTPLPAEYYPDDLVNDALSAVQFLRRQPEINAKAVGFWGSSEGGMLSTQAAARDHDVAFAINSSGFMGPLWETLLYQAEAQSKQNGLSAADIKVAKEFTELWMRVARTGKDYESFVKRREQLRSQKKTQLLTYVSDDFTSLEQMRWAWDHILIFSPLPALQKVTCPVLGVFGELDPLTDAAAAARAMQTGNSHVTVKIFPNASHSLGEMPARNRMAPGVFDTLRDWLHVHVSAE